MKIKAFLFFFLSFYFSLYTQNNLKNIIIESNKAIVEHKKEENQTKIIYENEVKLQVEHHFSATMESLQLLIDHKKTKNEMEFSFQKPSVIYHLITLSSDHAESKEITKKIIFNKNVLIKQILPAKKALHQKPIITNTEGEKAEIDLQTNKIILTGNNKEQVKTTISF